MSRPIIEVQNLSKKYRLGTYGARTLREEAERLVNRWFRKNGRNGHSHPEIAGQVANGSSPTAEPSTDFWALRDVSFSVEPGEVVGIIGRNGAGKSTLLKILSRITEPTGGEAIIRGRVASLLEVGTGFHPELSGRENIYLNGAILGMKKTEIDRKFDEIVAFAEVEQFLDTPVKRYSSGMYVRLAFAVAAHLDPEILIVDEVLAVGDSQFQKKCLTKMGEIGSAGRTVLIVSHNMASINNLCGRAILLQNGALVVQGAVGEVIPSYLRSGAELTGLFKPLPSEAPGTSKVRLVSVEITQDGLNGPSADVDISMDVVIRITYECLQDGVPFVTAMWLKDQVGTFVLCSGNAPDFNSITDPWYGRPHPKGVYCSEMRLPGNFLNNGRYLITTIVTTIPSTAENTQVHLEDHMSFEVHDTGAMRKTYFGHRVGVVHPPLPWETRRLEV